MAEVREMPRDEETGKPLYLLKNRYRSGFWSPKCKTSFGKCYAMAGHPGPCIPTKEELKLQVQGL